MITHGFAGTLEGSEQWIRASGLQHLRVVRESEHVAPSACMLRIPMAQYFGGRSVSMLGVAGVATAPEARGRGLGRRMMAEVVREAARDGFAITALYPSTPALYRQVGYEFAGHRFVTTIPVGRIDVRDRAGAVRPLTDTDDAAVRACYARFASAFDGLLDRGEYCWGRVRDSRGTKYAGFGIDNDRGGLDGYIYISQQRDPKTGFHDVATTDVVFATAAAGRRLLGLLADFATVGENATIWGGPIHPLVCLMSSRHYTVEKKDYWMVRLLDVVRAFESRGYSPGVRGQATLEITDDLIPGNAGTWTVRIENGRASVARTTNSSDAVHCHIRAIGPLFTGLYTVRQLALLGWIEGSDAAIAAADAAFAGSGGGPWMMDMF